MYVFKHNPGVLGDPLFNLSEFRFCMSVLALRKPDAPVRTRGAGQSLLNLWDVYSPRLRASNHHNLPTREYRLSDRSSYSILLFLLFISYLAPPSSSSIVESGTFRGCDRGIYHYLGPSFASIGSPSLPLPRCYLEHILSDHLAA
jgi:hypothetical protein